MRGLQRNTVVLIGALFLLVLLFAGAKGNDPVGRLLGQDIKWVLVLLSTVVSIFAYVRSYQAGRERAESVTQVAGLSFLPRALSVFESSDLTIDQIHQAFNEGVKEGEAAKVYTKDQPGRYRFQLSCGKYLLLIVDSDGCICDIAY